jgi:hypothetical protein
MSDRGGGFGPARLTPKEFRDLANFFKDYLADNPVIRWSIVAAGIGAVIETLHIGWLALRYIFKF